MTLSRFSIAQRAMMKYSLRTSNIFVDTRSIDNKQYIL